MTPPLLLTLKIYFRSLFATEYTTAPLIWTMLVQGSIKVSVKNEGISKCYVDGYLILIGIKRD